MFDVERLADFAETALQNFALAHQNETFYAFAIDAHLLCLNSEEQFQKALAASRLNPGDWEYQGFAMFGEQNGFDGDLYGEHYTLDAEQRKVSEYGQAMDRVLELLTARDAFGPLKKTDDFLCIRVEHDY